MFLMFGGVVESLAGEQLCQDAGKPRERRERGAGAADAGVFGDRSFDTRARVSVDGTLLRQGMMPILTRGGCRRSRCDVSISTCGRRCSCWSRSRGWRTWLLAAGLLRGSKASRRKVRDLVGARSPLFTMVHRAQVLCHAITKPQDAQVG